MNPHGPDRGFQLPGKQPTGQEALVQTNVFDVSEQRVAKVYAEALLNAAHKRQQAKEALEELESLVQDVFKSDPQFEAFLSSGSIGRDRKAAIIRSAFQGRASEAFVNFLLVLNDHERLSLIRPILAEATEIYNDRAGQMRVQVRSAVPLAEDQVERLKEELRASFQREPVLEMRIDPELIGGLVVQVEDWVIDASVRTRLDTIRNQLIARSSYEIQSRRDRFSSPDGN